MPIYWTSRDIPELAPMPPPERRRILRACMPKTWGSWQVWAALVAIPLLGGLGAIVTVIATSLLAAPYTWDLWWTALIGLVIGAGIGGGVLGHVRVSMARPYIRTLLAQGCVGKTASVINAQPHVCLKLCLAVAPVDDLQKPGAALADGGEVVTHSIPLCTIAQLQGDENASDLSITYEQGEDTTDSVTVTLPNSSKRDELLDTLKNHLGPTWISERTHESRLSASWWPFGATVGVTLLTWFMYLEAQQIAAGKQLEPLAKRGKMKLISELMHWIEALIGSTGVLILGCVLGVVCVGWLAYAVSCPPVRVTVRPKPAEPRVAVQN